MANPRRSFGNLNPSSPSVRIIDSFDQTHSPHQQHRADLISFFSKLGILLKKPLAFPILLFIFVILTWISLRFKQSSSHITVHTNTRQSYFTKDRDADANLVRFSTVKFPSKIFKDERGWIFNPLTIALEAGISGGAQSCVSSHLGEIRPGGVRGNHRHHTCNETFVFWGADTLFRLENQNAQGKGYSEIFIGADEVAVAASPVGTAHALINVDSSARRTFLFGCQDSVVNYSTPTTDFKTWDDI
ncbi:hypothetical protein ZOSMA_132G00590 [Zostera marina]|uniref:RmlC-like cupins superfamily protein n=1 Tax=Zostera marina TaxID=29655 RepID=A0A0K9Q1F2_ZOSMR|nr:hypothetical protein ZOSMA_132G00590 [Zostera marina]